MQNTWLGNLDFFVIQFHLASISKFYKEISPRPEFQILPAKNPKSPYSWGGVYPHELAVCQRAEFDCMGALGVYGGSKSYAFAADGHGRNQKAVRVFSCHVFFILGFNTPLRHQYAWCTLVEEKWGAPRDCMIWLYALSRIFSYSKTRKEYFSFSCFNAFQHSREFVNAKRKYA